MRPILIPMIALLVITTSCESVNNRNVRETPEKTVVKSGKALNKKNGKITSIGAWIPDHVEELEGMKLGPFVCLEDESILTNEEEGTRCLISKDEGNTWAEYLCFSRSSRFIT